MKPIETLPDMLETNRLRFRHVASGDEYWMVPLLDNYEVSKNLGRVPYPYDADMAKEFIQRARHMKETRQGFVYIIEGVKPMGLIGMEQFDRPAPELGYWLGEPFWGQGFMSEAAAALVTTTFTNTPRDRIESGYFVENSGSARVLEKTGFAPTGEVRQDPCTARGEDVAVRRMHLTRAAWQAQHEIS